MTLSELFPHDPLSLTQIVGYVAMALGVTAMLQKDDKRLKIMMTFMSVALITHFVMLDRILAAISVFMAGSRSFLSIFESVMRYKNPLTVFYLVAILFFTYFIYEEWVDIFPALGALNGTIAFFYLKGLHMRYALIFGAFLWLTHNFFSGSYGPFMMECILIMANIVTIIRLKKDVRRTNIPRAGAQL